MASITGISNQRYRKLFKGAREKLILRNEEAEGDLGKLARLVRQLEEAVVLADKDGYYFNKCPVCGAGMANPTTRHERSCTWPRTIIDLRG
tara:strand:+ start:137 stop:409 length:273 start_codon:yes stop_codon:yes gene_type:complete